MQLHNCHFSLITTLSTQTKKAILKTVIVLSKDQKYIYCVGISAKHFAYFRVTFPLNQ